MRKSKRLFLALAFIMSCGILPAAAQIYVNVRPARQVYVRTPSPGPRHVWVDEDWNQREGKYEWNGGRWAAPPHPGFKYKGGRWRHSQRGNRWTPGRWHR